MTSKIDVKIKIDEALLKEAEMLYDDLGMSLNTAISVFISQSVREQKLPFEISAPSISEKNE